MPKRLFNGKEKATLVPLSEVAGEYGATVWGKVRIADVLAIENSGLPSDLFSFAFKAHFDFVVVDTDDVCLFAVEFDGPSHDGENSRVRDELKNRICEHFEFPLLRVRSQHIDAKFRGMDLLTYFTSCWFLAKGFFEAQEQGHIPNDEPFDPCMILYNSRRKQRWPYWLSLEAQIDIENLYKAGRILDPCPSTWVGTDQCANHQSLSWLNVAADAWVYARGGLLSQQFPMYESDVLTQIAVFDIRKEVNIYLDGGANVINGKSLDQLIQRYRADYEECSVVFCGNGWPVTSELT